MVSTLLGTIGTVLLLVSLIINELFVDNGTSPLYTPMIQICRWNKMELSLGFRDCWYCECFGTENTMEQEMIAGIMWIMCGLVLYR